MSNSLNEAINAVISGDSLEESKSMHSDFGFKSRKFYSTGSNISKAVKELAALKDDVKSNVSDKATYAKFESELYKAYQKLADAKQIIDALEKKAGSRKPF